MEIVQPTSIDPDDFVTSVGNIDGTLTISPTTGAVIASLNLAHSNTWTGLQLLSRPGSNSLGLGLAPQAVFNQSSNTYGQLLFRSSGSDKAAIAWDVNGALHYIASTFFTHDWKIGTDEMMKLTNFGLIINGLGSGPSYTLDVRGTFNATSIVGGSVAYGAGVGGVVGDVNNIRYSDTDRFFGVDKASPSATIHAGLLSRSVGDISGLNLSIAPTTTGIPLGFSSKSYSAYAKRATGAGDIYSANPATNTVSEPSTSNYDPTGASCSETFGSGYDTATDPPPSYEIIALYDSGNAKSPMSTSTSIGSWSGSNPFADVQVSWSAPSDTTYLYGYLVIRNGTDYLTTSSSTTSFVDSNSGWSVSPPSPSVFQWSISGSFLSVADATDYVVLNTTDTTYILTGGSTSFSDTGSGWTSGTPTLTPTSIDEVAVKSDGDMEVTDATKGLILTDTVTSTRYRVQVTSGALVLTAI